MIGQVVTAYMLLQDKDFVMKKIITADIMKEQ